jgi:hypothetical protein
VDHVAKVFTNNEILIVLPFPMKRIKRNVMQEINNENIFRGIVKLSSFALNATALLIKMEH